MPKYRTVGIKLFIVGAVIAGSRTSSAVVIGFDNMTGETKDVYSGHSEKGFDILPTEGPWRKSFFGGKPTPCIFFGMPYDIAYKGTVRVTRSDGGLFRFNSFDPYAPGRFCEYQGWRNGQQVYGSNILNGAGFGTIKCDFATQVDAITITLESFTDSDMFALDNIDVTPVPEPAVWLGLAGGFGALMSRRRSMPAARPSTSGLGGRH